MIIIPPEEVDEFLANESKIKFTEEQLAFFKQAKKNYRLLVAGGQVRYGSKKCFEGLWKIMELKDISTRGLLETREKYAKALVTRNVVWSYLWSYCSICVEVLPRHSCEECPLFGPRWCRSSAIISRLHPDSHYNIIDDAGVLGLDYKLEWERDVTIFLKWITTELVSRGAGVFEFD